MELREIRSLTTLADTSSIAQIAQAIHLSPSAIHKQLKSLENELGVRLYARVGRRLQLTPAGQILLPYFRDLLAQYEAACSALDEWKGRKKALVRLGAGPTICTYILPPLLKKFRHRYPKVDLFIETGHSLDLVDGLRKGSLDLALLVHSELLAEPYLSAEVFWDFEFVLVSNLPGASRQCSIADLKNHPFILFQRGSRMENLIDRYLSEVGFQPKVIMRFDNAEAIKSMVKTGLGISVLPFWILDADIRNHALSVIRQAEHPLFSKVVLTSRKSNYIPKPVAAFIELARSFNCRNPRLTSRKGDRH